MSIFLKWYIIFTIFAIGLSSIIFFFLSDLPITSCILWSCDLHCFYRHLLMDVPRYPFWLKEKKIRFEVPRKKIEILVRFLRKDVITDSQKLPTFIIRIIIIMTAVYHFYIKPLKSRNTFLDLWDLEKGWYTFRPPPLTSSLTISQYCGVCQA